MYVIVLAGMVFHVWYLSRPEPARSKRGREERDGTEKCHKLSQIFVTFYDEFYDDL